MTSATDSSYTLTLSLTESSRHAQRYVVQIIPSLPVGGRVGYRRVFEMENFLPLSADELRTRAEQSSFPSLFRSGSETWYGLSFEVYYETNWLKAVYEFPSEIAVDHYRAVALVDRSREVNHTETARINAPGAVTCDRPVDRDNVSVSLEVENPLIGHRYILLYGLAG